MPIGEGWTRRAASSSVTNRYLDLEPVVAGIARRLGLAAFGQEHEYSSADQEAGRTSSHWVVLARNERTLGPLVADERWRDLSTTTNATVWTDQSSNILQVVSWLGR